MDTLIESIKDAESRIENLKQLMAEAQSDFLKSTAEYAKDFFWKQFRKSTINTPEVTKRLGVDGIRSIQEEVCAIQNEIDFKIVEVVGALDLWWHLKPAKQEYHQGYGACFSEVGKSVRKLLGPLGPILEKNIFIEPYPHDNEAWKEWHDRGRTSSDNLPTYCGTMHWSKDMNLAMDKYFSLHSNAKRLLFELERLRREKAEKEAQDIWNQACS
jgi:hypothetical protein